jgi:hypothetical protein
MHDVVCTGRSGIRKNSALGVTRRRRNSGEFRYGYYGDFDAGCADRSGICKNPALGVTRRNSCEFPYGYGGDVDE